MELRSTPGSQRVHRYKRGSGTTDRLVRVLYQVQYRKHDKLQSTSQILRCTKKSSVLKGITAVAQSIQVHINTEFSPTHQPLRSTNLLFTVASGAP